MSPIERSAGGGGASVGGMALLFDSTLGAPAAIIDTGAGGIAGTSKHLYFEIYARDAAAVNADSIVAQFNADAAANYDYIFLRNQAGALTAGSGHATTSAIVGHMPGANVTANYFGTANGSIMSYSAVTTGFKGGNSLCGEVLDVDANSNQITVQFAWRSTAAITRMSIAAGAGGNFLAGSRLTIYGTP